MAQINVGQTSGGGMWDLASLQLQQRQMQQQRQQQAMSNIMAIADAMQKQKQFQQEQQLAKSKIAADILSKSQDTTYTYQDASGKPVTYTIKGAPVDSRLQGLLDSLGIKSPVQPAPMEQTQQPNNTLNLNLGAPQAQGQQGIMPTVADYQNLVSQQGFSLNTNSNIPISPERRLDNARRLTEAKGLTFPQQPQTQPTQPTAQVWPPNVDAIETTSGKVPKFIMRPATSEKTYGMKEEQFKAKRLQQMGDDLDWNKNVRSAYGVTAQGLHRAERLGALVSRYPDMNLDRREMEEMAIGLNAILAGSNQSAQEQVRGLIPKSVWGNVQKFTEWLSNNPQGLQQQEFVKRMYKDVKREEDTMYNQLLRDAQQKLSKYTDIEKKYPEDWANTLQSWGIDPQSYQDWKAGGYKKISVVPQGMGQPSGQGQPAGQGQSIVQGKTITLPSGKTIKLGQ